MSSLGQTVEILYGNLPCMIGSQKCGQKKVLVSWSWLWVMSHKWVASSFTYRDPTDPTNHAYQVVALHTLHKGTVLLIISKCVYTKNTKYMKTTREFCKNHSDFLTLKNGFDWLDLLPNHFFSMYLGAGRTSN